MSARAQAVRGGGADRLRALLETLSPRDISVLEAVGEHRFLTTNQLERLLFTEHASLLSASRTSRRVVGRLHDHGLLSLVPRRVGGFQAGSASSVWFLSPIGKRLLALRSGDGMQISAARVRDPSVRFVDHALAIAELRVQVGAAARLGQFGLTSIEIEPTSWRHYLGTSGVRETLKPDLAVNTTSADGEYEDRWFVEIDLGTEHLPTVMRKCQQYETYRRTADEQARYGIFPVVAWLTRDQSRADKMTRAIKTARSLDQDLFRALPADRFVDLVAGGAQ